MFCFVFLTHDAFKTCIILSYLILLYFDLHVYYIELGYVMF